MTGGGGYVGSLLCRRLAERGYSVVAFDIHYPEEEPRENDEDNIIQRIKVFGK